MNEYLEKRTSFAIETNLADTDTWKFLIETQKLGYEVVLLYMSTDDIQILNERIERRTLAGEHYIRPDIVEQRYVNSLNLLNHYFVIPDHIQLFDNSEFPRLIAEVTKGRAIEVRAELPMWIRNYLPTHLSNEDRPDNTNAADLKSIDEVRERYQTLRGKSVGSEKKQGRKQ